jgi:glycosyltransferase 2 family protein
MKKRLGLVARVLGTAAALAWIATRVDLPAARSALARIPVHSFAIAVALVAANVAAGAVRWQVLLRAYGAVRIPRLATLVRLYFVAFFYNNYLPGAVAGDVARGVVTGDAFASEGATGALAVVLVERALGLFGLFALLAAGLIAGPGALDRGALWWWTVVGSAGSLALVAALPMACKICAWLPRRGPLARIAAIAGQLPALRDGRAFGAALLLSIATQALVAAAGWLLLAALAPIGLPASLLVVPLAAATAFLPITVGGAGAREAVYVALCGQLFDMPRADALAASLGLWLAHLIVGAAGGVLQLQNSRSPR